MRDGWPFSRFFIDYGIESNLARVGVPELVIVFLTALALLVVPNTTLRLGRKVAILSLLTTVALVTPTPDLISLCYIFVPFYLCGEAVVFLVRTLRPRQALRA